MSKTKKQGLGWVCCLIAAGILFGMFNGALSANAAVKTDEVLSDGSGLTLDEDTWMMQGDGGIISESADNYMKITASLDHRFVFMQNAITVENDEDLIFEYDLLGNTNIKPDNTEASPWVGQYGPLKGLDTSENELFTARYVSEMIYAHNHNFLRGFIGYEQYRAAITELRPDYFGGPDAVVETANGTVDGVLKDADYAWKFYNEDYSSAIGTGGNHGFGLSGFRYIFNYKAVGSLEIYRKAILSAGNYGSEEFVVNVRPGTFLDRSGQIGFYVQGIGATVELIIDNVKISTKKEATITEKYATNFQNGFADWKMNAVPAPLPGEELSGTPTGVVFDDPDESNYLVANASKAIVYDRSVGGVFAEIRSTFTLTALAGSRKAGFMFNLETSGDTYTTDGVVFVGFMKDGSDTKFVITKGNGTGADTIAVSPALATDLSSPTEISLKSFVDGSIRAEFGADELAFGSSANPIILAKRMGIIAVGAKSGGNEAVFTIGGVVITNRTSYISDSAKDVYMNFDGVDSDGDAWYNEDAFRISSYPGEIAPSENGTEGVYLKNGKLVFDNAGHNSYFTPRYKYTDFEMILDISGLSHTFAKSSGGQVVRPVSNSPIIIGLNLSSAISSYSDNYFIGIRTPLTKDFGEPDYAEAVGDLMQNSFVFAGGALAVKQVSGMRHNMLNPAYDGGTFRFRIVAKNKTISVSYCLLGYENYEMLDEIVYSAECNKPFFGYVGLSCTSFPQKMAGNFTVDNFILRNTDTMSASYFVTENEPGESAPVDDDTLPDSPDDGAPSAPADGDPTAPPKSSGCGGCGSAIFCSPANLAAFAALFVAVAFVCRLILRRKKKNLS
jgi:hypothetical protein